MYFYKLEYTDTFGGESNYSWVRRIKFSTLVDNKRAIVRAAKRALGLQGRVKLDCYGDTIEMRPVGMATVAFIEALDEIDL